MVDCQITIPTRALIAFCERYPIRKLSLFGSVLRDDFTPESDIDVLVEFMPDSGVTFLDMVLMQDELAGILGRDVDLLTPNALSSYFRDRVLAAAETVYERV
ncbi:MAG: nucleotidyltransferase family protein [Anaerolineae bacterium]|nr:nucleotidyltransferase family protein [Anaerolineae bacterium]